jgi:hypothetical protein
MTIRKGSGLALVKMMLRMKMPDDFGKAFMKGVTGIIIINYIDASAETVESLRADIYRFTAVLEEFKSDNKGESPSNDHTRSFAAMSGPNTLSAFVIAIEDSALLIIVVDGIKKIVELVVAEFFFQVLWQSFSDICNGLLVIEVFHCEFVVVHGCIILKVPQT